jgi:hypothetical protein
VPVVSPGGRVTVGVETTGAVGVAVGTDVVGAAGVVGSGVETVGDGVVEIVGAGVVVIVGGAVVIGGSTTGGGVVMVFVVDGIDGEVCVTVRPGGVVTVVVVAGGVGVVAVGVVGIVATGPVGVVDVAVESVGVEVVGAAVVLSFDEPSSLSVRAPAAWARCAGTTVDGVSECGTIGAAGDAGAGVCADDAAAAGDGGVTCARALDTGCGRWW